MIIPSTIIALCLYCAAVLPISGALASDPLCADVPSGKYGFFPYVGNCSKYWECYEGSKTAMDCPEGLEYNANLGGCDFPEVANCSYSIDPVCKDVPIGEESLVPNEDNCTQYWVCYMGEKTEMVCPDGLWFNDQLKKCDYPELSGCGEYKNRTDAPESSSTTSTTSVRPTWTTPDPACWGVRPGQTVLRPYRGNCNLFWECEGASKTLMYCPSHLYFNEARQVCDWPSESGCDQGTTDNPITTVSPPTTPKGDDDPRCADGKSSYWPVSYDCTKYVQCYKGRGYEMDCPNNLYFDSSTQKCVNPADSDCGRTTVSTPAPTEGTTRDHDWTADPDCSVGERYLLPYIGDCKKFWECDNGNKVLRFCPASLWFNAKLMICDYPYQSGCKY